MALPPSVDDLARGSLLHREGVRLLQPIGVELELDLSPADLARVVLGHREHHLPLVVAVGSRAAGLAEAAPLGRLGAHLG